MDSPHLVKFREALTDWTDERFITADELYALAVFFLYLVNLAELDEWEYNGHSLKVAVPMCTLTVKARVDNIPVVVFTSGRTPTGCVKMFIRKYEAGLLEWRDDQYRT